MSTLTIITDDKLIVVDGTGLVCNFDIDPDIHAVQWNGTTGHVEYKSGKENKKLSNINDYKSFFNVYSEEMVKMEQEVYQTLQAEQDEIEKTPLYQRNRLNEYSALREQLDMIYWDKKNGTTVWESHIDFIKNKYPKS